MKPTEIIVADAQSNGIDPQNTLNYVSDAIQNRNGVLVKKNNSVLLLTPIAQNIAEWNLFTQDTGSDLIDSVNYFIDEVRKTDIAIVYGMVDNLETLQLVNDLGLRVVQSDDPEYQWMAEVQ